MAPSKFFNFFIANKEAKKFVAFDPGKPFQPNSILTSKAGYPKRGRLLAFPTNIGPG